MFCHNCGNKLEENTIVCTKCGAVVGRSNYKENIKKKGSNIKGSICFVFGIVSVLLCFSFMLKDISSVGMYTKIIDRLYYGFDLVLAPLLLSFVTLIISYSGKDNDKALNKTGLFLSIVSLFMIIIEIVIVIIY